MSTPLERAFQQAIRDLNSMPKDMILPEKTKLRLYGLYSSVVKGSALPKVSLEVIMSNKTEALKRKAWREALKLTNKQAMEEYCEIVKELKRENQRQVKLSGHLLRKDNKEGWKRCYVELKERVLYYYDENETITNKTSSGGGQSYPSGVLFLMDGFVVSFSNDKVEPNLSNNAGQLLFRFSIAHPKSHKVFMLASTRKEEAQKWVDNIRLESTRKTTANSDNWLGSNKQSMAEEHASSFASKHFLPPLRSAQDFGVPAAFSFVTDECVSSFLNLTTDKSLWAFSQEKSKVRTFLQDSQKLPGLNLDDCKSAVAVVGHALEIQAPVRAVFDLVWTMGARRNVDVQLESWSVVEELGPQTRVDHVVYSAVWPTSKRDFCRLSHYRVDENTGAVLVVGVSVDHLMCPPSRDAVRARLFCTGFLIAPLSDTTCEVKYLIVVDPVISNIPRKFIVSVAATQTSILDKIQAYLAEHDHLINGAVLKGAVKNIALASPNLLKRRKKRSTASIISSVTNGGGAVFVKNNAFDTLPPMNLANIQQKRVRVMFEDDHPERWWLKFWLAGVTCAAATASLDPRAIQLIALVLAAFAVILASNKRAFITAFINVPSTLDRKNVAITLQNVLKDCPSMNGTFSTYGRWRPSSTPRVAVLGELRGGSAVVYIEGENDPSAGDGESKNNASDIGGEEEYTALFVSTGIAPNHDAWSDRPVLFSSFGDKLMISVDRRCVGDLAKFVSQASMMLEPRPTPTATTGNGPGHMLQRHHSMMASSTPNTDFSTPLKLDSRPVVPPILKGASQRSVM